jgi:Ras-related protein Rab-6A
MYDFSFKLALLGEEGVGKTSLLNQFIHSRFGEDLYLTGGRHFVKSIDLQERRIRLEFFNDSYMLNLYREREKQIKQYFQNVNGGIFIYDITNRDSLTLIYYWWDVLINLVGDIPTFLIGNKFDLHEKRKISREEGIEIAEELGASIFVESSAKAGINVHSVFKVIAEVLMDESHLKLRPIKMTDQLKEKVSIAKKIFQKKREEQRKIAIKIQKLLKKKHDLEIKEKKKLLEKQITPQLELPEEQLQPKEILKEDIKVLLENGSALDKDNLINKGLLKKLGNEELSELIFMNENFYQILNHKTLPRRQILCRIQLNWRKFHKLLEIIDRSLYEERKNLTIIVNKEKVTFIISDSISAFFIDHPNHLFEKEGRFTLQNTEILGLRKRHKYLSLIIFQDKITILNPTWFVDPERPLHIGHNVSVHRKPSQYHLNLSSRLKILTFGCKFEILREKLLDSYYSKFSNEEDVYFSYHNDDNIILMGLKSPIEKVKWYKDDITWLTIPVDNIRCGFPGKIFKSLIDLIELASPGSRISVSLANEFPLRIEFYIETLSFSINLYLAPRIYD